MLLFQPLGGIKTRKTAILDFSVSAIFSTVLNLTTDGIPHRENLNKEDNQRWNKTVFFSS